MNEAFPPKASGSINEQQRHDDDDRSAESGDAGDLDGSPVGHHGRAV